MGDQAAVRHQALSTPRRLGASLVVCAASVVLFACSGSEGEVRPAAACTLPPEIEFPGGVPDDFPWVDEVWVTQAESKKKFVTISGFSEESVEDLFEIMRRELDAEGFDIINTDYEGFEAELYFAKGNSLAGIAALREGPCDGYVKLNVIYDPLETAAGREAVRRTRRLSGQTPTPDG